MNASDRLRAPGARRAAACLLAAVALLSGCATYTSRVSELRPALVEGRFDAALQTLEEHRSGKDLLLYWLERGLVLHYADRWAESNEALQAAEDLAADLYTRSISEGALSLLTSDETISYRASPHEMAMVPYYRALNYAYLGLREDALVEARKASLFLRRWVGLTAEALGEADGSEPEAARDLDLLANNAFLQYFSAMLYEWDGELNDAFIAYRNAADAYRVAEEALAVRTPPWLGEDLRRTGRRLGFDTELQEIESRLPALFPAAAAAPTAEAPPPGPRGEVVLLFEIGYVAHRQQAELNLPILKTDERRDVSGLAETLRWRARPGYVAPPGVKIDYWLRVAVPELVQTPSPVTELRVSAPVVGGHAVAVGVEDVSGRARLAHRAQEGKILLKTLARGLTKYAAAETADDKGVFAGVLANVLGAVTEKADTRSWLTLPERIALVRLSLPPGRYDLTVEVAGAAGAPLRVETVEAVEVRAGDWTFANRRVF